MKMTKLKTSSIGVIYYKKKYNNLFKKQKNVSKVKNKYGLKKGVKTFRKPKFNVFKKLLPKKINIFI